MLEPHERLDHVVRDPEHVRGVAVGDPHHLHSRGKGRGDPGHGVLEGEAVRGLVAGGERRQLPRGHEVGGGVGLGAGHVVRAHDHGERLPQLARGEDGLDLRVARAGGDAQRHFRGESAHDVARAGEEGDVLQDFPEAGHLQARDPVHLLQVGGDAVVLEHAADGPPVVEGQVLREVVLAGNRDPLGQHGVTKGLEMEGLAVHEHAVEVEDHRSHGMAGL